MNYKVLIVVSNYYEEISKNLIEGAEMCLRETSITPRIIKVPGCFEIPYIIKKKDKDLVLTNLTTNPELTIDESIDKHKNNKIAIIPEGPYVVPIYGGFN